jgi:hypothetical protein
VRSYALAVLWVAIATALYGWQMLHLVRDIG